MLRGLRLPATGGLQSGAPAVDGLSVLLRAVPSRIVPVVVLALGLVGGVGGTGVAQAAEPRQLTQRFHPTGMEQTFVVPPNVTSLAIDAVGGAGGGSDLNGRRGARVRGTLAVTPGDTLYVAVGGPGELGSPSSPSTNGGRGGFNGGGRGGANAGGEGGGGGGGASDIRTCSRNATSCGTQDSVDSRLFVAAGGGGASNTDGGDAGSSGLPFDVPCGAFLLNGCSGGPGTATYGGHGGDGAQSQGQGAPGYLRGGTGGDGAPGSGGIGGSGQRPGGGGGGGGGGGLYGGGGGGGGEGRYSGPGAGGGGGSSLVPAGWPAAAPTSDRARVDLTYAVGPPAVATVRLDRGSIVADGTSAANATIGIQDADGNGVPGVALELTSSDSETTFGSIVDSDDGYYRVKVTSTQVPGDVDVTVRVEHGVPAVEASTRLVQTPAARYDLTVATTGTGQGTVKSSPAGITCATTSAANCAASFDTGIAVVLTATPVVGSDFTGFSGGGCAGTGTWCIVALDQVRRVTATFTDGDAPNTHLQGGPVATVRNDSASFSFSATETGSTFACRLDDAAWGPCSSPKTLADLSDGQHTFAVRATDRAGNTDPTPAGRTWTIDATAPETVLDSGPQGTLATAEAALEFSSEPGASFECLLDHWTWEPCTSPKTYAALADGEHTVAVRATDAAGNTDRTPERRTWSVDTAAPETTVDSGPSGTVATSAATIGFSSEPDATYACRTDAGAWSSCTSPAPVTGLADGAHTFEVRAADAVGNVDPTPAIRTWSVDTVAPETAIAAGPVGVVQATTATFVLSSEDGAPFECRLDSGAWDACGPLAIARGLADGEHTLEVRARDAVGNRDQTPAARTWTVDATAPETTIDGGPLGTVGTGSATVAFSSEPDATFECRLDAAAWEPCTGSRTYDALADGEHTVAVRASDAVGNTDASPATRTWTVDTAAPETALDSGPSGTVATRTGDFAFSSEPGASFECRVDTDAWKPCTSPATVRDVQDGIRSFAVRAIDTAGNTDRTPATRSWIVDATAPDTTLVSGPTGTVKATSAAFFFASEPGASFECRLDTKSWAACTTPTVLTGLAHGEHTYAIRARDALGNTDGTPVIRTWTVDAVAPDTTIDDGPTGTATGRSATLAFSSEPGATFECRLDVAAWAPCTSPRTYADLTNGPHTVAVRATDAVGNTDATPASRSWVVETVPPDTAVTGGPSGTVTSTGASFSFASDPGATFSCQVDAEGWIPCTSPQGYAGLRQGEHTFAVRATGAGGSTDRSPATRTWTVDTIAPDTTITDGFLGPVTSATPRFAFSSEPGATFACRLDDGDWATCDSPKTYAAQSEGEHTFAVRATDAAGNVDQSPATSAFTVDTTVPDTTLTDGPTGTVRSTSASFAFSGEPAGGFECRLDGEAWSRCESPHALAWLADGEHAFAVRSVDAAGNADGSPATRTWTVDGTAPSTALVSGPMGTTESSTAEFVFSSEPGATFACQLDGRPLPTCASPTRLTGLADGTHTFAVRATDAVGNTEPPTAIRRWTVAVPQAPRPTPPATTTTTPTVPRPVQTPSRPTPAPAPADPAAVRTSGAAQALGLDPSLVRQRGALAGGAGYVFTPRRTTRVKRLRATTALPVAFWVPKAIVVRYVLAGTGTSGTKASGVATRLRLKPGATRLTVRVPARVVKALARGGRLRVTLSTGTAAKTAVTVPIG